MRPETGPMKFGGDWRGIFIRGDDAFRFALRLKQEILTRPAVADRLNPIHLASISTLVALLEESNQHEKTDEQVGTSLMKPFEECVDGEIKTCEQCHQDYLAGTGTTETGASPVRLSERFCSESCADTYEEEFKET